MKMKTLETFCIALITPISKSFKQRNVEDDSACFYTEVSPLKDTYALTSVEIEQPFTDIENQRAQLISDIMNDNEIKIRFSQTSNKTEPEQICERFSLDKQNLLRLKNLQNNYDELMVCYESLKGERDSLLNKCANYDELEAEVNKLQQIVEEYNKIWYEKEHLKKRSDDLNVLKEQFIVLSEETNNLESQLKAETEINLMKSQKIMEIANENINLEKRISDITISFEKEKNALECKLKESQCMIMCQEQQIKSMSLQIDKLLQQENKETTTVIYIIFCKDRYKV